MTLRKTKIPFEPIGFVQRQNGAMHVFRCPCRRRVEVAEDAKYAKCLCGLYDVVGHVGPEDAVSKPE